MPNRSTPLGFHTVLCLPPFFIVFHPISLHAIRIFPIFFWLLLLFPPTIVFLPSRRGDGGTVPEMVQLDPFHVMLRAAGATGVPRASASDSAPCCSPSVLFPFFLSLKVAQISISPVNIWASSMTHLESLSHPKGMPSSGGDVTFSNTSKLDV